MHLQYLSIPSVLKQKISNTQYAKMQGGWEERKTWSTAGGPFIVPWREGVREGVCIIRRDAQVPYYLPVVT